MGFGVVGRRGILGRKVARQSPRNRAGDLRFDLHPVVGRAVVGLAPDREAVASTIQFDGDVGAIAGALHAAFHHGLDV